MPVTRKKRPLDKDTHTGLKIQMWHRGRLIEGLIMQIHKRPDEEGKGAWDLEIITTWGTKEQERIRYRSDENLDADIKIIA